MTFRVTKCQKRDERDLATPLTLNTLKTVSDAFVTDLASMNLTEQKISSQYIYRHVVAFNELAESYPMCTLRCDQKGTQWITAMNSIASSLEDNADGKADLHTGGEDSEAALDDLQDGFRITHYAKRGDDSFYLDFTAKQLILKNYANDTTKTALETWADTKTVLA